MNRYKAFTYTLVTLITAASVLFISGCFGMWGGSVPPPSGLTATTDLPDSIELSWDAVDGAGRYHVYRSTQIDGTYERVGITDNSGWADADVEQERPYYYKVSSTDYYGENESEKTDSAGNPSGNFALQERRSKTEEEQTDFWWANLGTEWKFLPITLSLHWSDDVLFGQYLDTGTLKEKRYK